jgi:hypothetical protein
LISFWAFGLVTAILWVISLPLGVDYYSIIQGFWWFLTGNPYIRETRDPNLREILKFSLGVINVNLLLVAVIGTITLRYYGEPEENDHGVFDLPPSYIFQDLLVVNFLEEFSARWLFLGQLTKLLPGQINFYSLLLIGNTLWAGLHLWNYKLKDRLPIFILSQFVGGLFFSYTFMKYGLIFTTVLHVGFNTVLLMMSTTERFVKKLRHPDCHQSMTV